jgi:hypothetical protein
VAWIIWGYFSHFLEFFGEIIISGGKKQEAKIHA